MKKPSKLKAVFPIIILLILGAFMLYYYFYLGNMDKSKTSLQEKTDIRKMLDKDLTASYPSSPRDVVKTHNQIRKLFYNSEKWKKNELEDLISQFRLLMDEELLAENPEEEHIANLKADISDYKSKKKTIITTVVQNSNLVEYWKGEDNQEFASLKISCTINEKGNYSKVYEQFILRKNQEGKWKIMGWQLTDEVEIDGD